METTEKGGGFPAGSSAHPNALGFLAGKVFVAEGDDRKSPKMEDTNVFAA
jgi:hypothetical protein